MSHVYERNRLFLIPLFCCYNIVSASNFSQEGQLIKDLFQNYDKRVKPTANANTQINIHIAFVLSKVESLVS